VVKGINPGGGGVETVTACSCLNHIYTLALLLPDVTKVPFVRVKVEKGFRSENMLYKRIIHFSDFKDIKCKNTQSKLCCCNSHNLFTRRLMYDHDLSSPQVWAIAYELENVGSNFLALIFYY